MSIKNLLFRFFLANFGLHILASIVLTYFNVKSNAGADIGILVASIYYVCISFGKQNKRYFTKQEKLKVVFGLIFANILVQQLLILAYAIATNTTFSNKATLISLGLIGFLHGIFIYFLVGSARKMLIKDGTISE
ncbi:MAG: ABZJ_00895 family protein [Methylophilaceae bacterium]